MAGVTIRIEDDALRTALASLSARLGNMQDVMDDIGSRLVGLARIGFTQQQAPEGTSWKPLTASTILARQKRGKWPGPILRVSGSLFSSLNWKAGPTSVEIGAGWGQSGPYAAIHQFGGQAGRGHKVTIPARPYLPMSPLPDAYLQSCLDAISQGLMGGGANG